MKEETDQDKAEREVKFVGHSEQRKIRDLLAEGNVAAAFCAWCEAAEAFTADVANLGFADAKKHLGRARGLRFKKVSATAKLQKGKEAQGEASQDVIDLAKLEKRTATLAAKLKRRTKLEEQGTQMQQQEI